MAMCCKSNISLFDFCCFSSASSIVRISSCSFLHRVSDKKLCYRKEAARCFVSVQLEYNTSSTVFYYQLFRLQIYHCVQLNSFLFSSLRHILVHIGPCCRPSQTNVRWCVADCAIYTAWSSVTVFATSQFARPSIDRQPVVRGRLCHRRTQLRRR